MPSVECEAGESGVEPCEPSNFTLQASHFKLPMGRPRGRFCLEGRDAMGYIAAIERVWCTILELG